MNTLTLVKNFIEGDKKEFYSTFNKIMEMKIADKKLPIENSCVEGIFEEKNDLNIQEDLNYSILDVLQESFRQKSTIAVTFKDGNESILSSSESKSILNLFDQLNESNQKTLINNLFSSKNNFKSTINFCSKI
tara:strand:+ start:2008 stop:2406 length:399 start_codon:yes stop_codon:yes gene_type:complete